MPTVALYTLQAALGLMILAAGCAKLIGFGGMVEAFDLLGLGSSVRLTIGAIEVAAGVCLLMPRAGLIGALMLAGMVTLAAGGAIGQTVSSGAAGTGIGARPVTVSESFQPALCMGHCRPASATLGAKRSWDI